MPGILEHLGNGGVAAPLKLGIRMLLPDQRTREAGPQAFSV